VGPVGPAGPRLEAGRYGADTPPVLFARANMLREHPANASGSAALRCPPLSRGRARCRVEEVPFAEGPRPTPSLRHRAKLGELQWGDYASVQAFGSVRLLPGEWVPVQIRGPEAPTRRA
jgi:hypothetical protein